MAVGITVTAGDLNLKAGALVVGLWRALDDAHEFKLWLDQSVHNDSFLTALGFSAGDITLLRNSFTDLNTLWNVSHGGQATGASNFFSNATQLTGTNYTG